MKWLKKGRKRFYISFNYSCIISLQATKGWDHFYGESWALKTPCKDFNLAITGGLGWMKWLKKGRKRFYVSCNYSCIISLQATKGWDHFYGESWALKTPCKDFNLAITGGLGWMKWLKKGRKRFYVSCNYSYIISLQATKGWDHFYGESWALKTPCKDFNLAITWGLGWMKWLKKGRKRFYISCNYSCIISFLVKILLVKVPLYSVCLNFNHEK